MFKPYDLATIQLPTSARPRIVEVISMPIPNENGPDTILVRWVPGDPNTLSPEIPVTDLLPYQKKRYVHVAEVTNLFAFPEDMLRYDAAALYDQNIFESGGPTRGLRKEKVLIYKMATTKYQKWTYGRWESFQTSVQPVLTIDLTKQFPESISKLR